MLSLHIIADNAPQERLDRAVLYLKRTKQPYVNIAGGSQVDRAMQLVERVQGEVPGIQVFWRVLEDTGNIFSMSSQEWWNMRIAPRLKWMQERKIITVIDNESSGNDDLIKAYVQNSISRMKMLHGAGLGGAFSRFATGNIQEHQYQLLKPLLDKLTLRDWISPNEYTNIPGKSSGGHLERWKRIQAVTTNPLNVSIGECGILNEYRANDGYRSVGMSDQTMAQILLNDEVWYGGGATIPRFVFCIGGYSNWDSLQVGDGALEYWENHYATYPLPPIHPPTLPPPVLPPIPPPATTVVVSRAELASINANLKAQVQRLDDIIKRT